ncbi:MAG: hypothetical protein QNJ92_01245 [Alphaproteobacteria bacterium]|nr:hypothetical protein [Alphaproteobacteria bacterium]
MLTLEDCLALCELTEEEIQAVAVHEHIPEIAAAEMAEYLVHQPDGPPRIRKMIRDDIADARDRGDTKEVLRLKHVLRHFVDTHGEELRAFEEARRRAG